jgi:hypothetical protein
LTNCATRCWHAARLGQVQGRIEARVEQRDLLALAREVVREIGVRHDRPQRRGKARVLQGL